MRILCIKWGEKYGPEYVLRLKAACDRHIPHREFWCMTDRPVPGVFCVPMNTTLEGWWSKLGLFRTNYFHGDNLYLDLDVVVTGGIQPLIDAFQSDPSKVWAIDDFSYSLARPKQGLSDWALETLGGAGTINSSVMLWRGLTNGTPMAELASRVESDRSVLGNLHGDQNFITKSLWPDYIRLLPAAGIVGSYKYHAGQVFPLTVFHGDPKPADVADDWVLKNWAA